MRGTLRVVMLVAAVGGGWAVWDRMTYDPEPWLQDLAALEDSLAQGYANLDHQVARGVVDPVALHARTDSMLRVAGSRWTAAGTLTDFAAAFQDGHLSVRRAPPAPLRWLKARSSGHRDAPPLRSATASEACRALGHDNGDRPSLLELADGWHGVSNEAGAPGGILPVGGAVVGVLRIASFGVDRHLPACERAWSAAARVGETLQCDAACRDALWIGTADSILAAHRRTLSALRAAGATTLIIDLTGNGGGNEWVGAAARQVSAQRLEGHVAGAIRHPHHRRWVMEAGHHLRAVRHGTHDSTWAMVLDSALARIARQAADINASCDRGSIWHIPGPPPCPILATHALTTGWLPHLPPAERDRPGAGDLFTPLTFAYEEGVWTGPVIVLVDRRSASASEDFVVTLADQDAAVIVGERTYGAGCGMTNGGIGFTLPHSGLSVRMPDCARIRRNGENEVAGVAPHVEAGWQDSDPEIERAKKAVAAIAGVVSR